MQSPLYTTIRNMSFEALSDLCLTWRMPVIVNRADTFMDHLSNLHGEIPSGVRLLACHHQSLVNNRRKRRNLDTKYFTLATGMRPEEYLALKWSDLDLHAGTATVRRTLIWRKSGGWYFTEPKTSRSRRTVPLPLSLVRDLIDHRRKQGESR